MSILCFGIDLGTSTSIISYLVNGRPVPISDPLTKSPIIPSVVALTRKGELVVGQSAIVDGLPDKKIRESKRDMGTDKEYRLGDTSLRPEDVAALVLRKVRDVAELSLGRPVDEVVITVPAYFDDLPRRATERAAQLAGVPLLRLISEPVAAAMAYGLDKQEDEGVLLVFDFGGGTLDVTIIEMFAGVLEVKTTDGDKALGGKDIDEVLIQLIAQKSGHPIPTEPKSWEALKQRAESLKKELSSTFQANLYAPSIESDGVLSDWDVNITRDELELAVAPLLHRASERIAAALDKAKITKSQVNRLLLVGGSCYMPCVREMVQQYFDLKAVTGVDPDLAISMGAAISAGLKKGAIDSRTSLVVQDAANFRMGISCLSQIGDQIMLVFNEMMPANAPIPFVRTDRFHLLRVDQDVVEFQVLQDPTGTRVLAEDAIPTGAIGVIKDIPPSTTGEPRMIDIEYRYDENQITRVNAKVVGLDKEVTIQLNSDQIQQNPLSKLTGSGAVDTLWEKSPLAGRNGPLIKRAENVMGGQSDKSEILEAALLDLKSAVAANDEVRAKAAREKLSDILIDLE